MPKKRSIKTSSPSDFEPKRKNPISLGSDSNIGNDFKPLKIGGKNTGLEFADNKILSSAEEFVTLKERTEELKVSKIKGNKSAGFYSPQVIMQSDNATDSSSGLWFNIFTSGMTFLKANGTFASLSLEATSTIYNACGDDNAYGFIWKRGTFTSGSQVTVANLYSTGQFKLREASNAISDDAGYGQLWIKNEDPNELYFTNDDGDDIQITSGSGLAGSGGGDITSVVAGVGLSGGGTSSDVTLTLDMSELTDMTASVNSSEDELIILDNGADRRKLISEIPLSAFNNDSGFVTATLTDEQVQDKVGAMFSSNTETLITATYQDGDGTVDLVVDNDLSNYDNSSSGFITATLTTEQVQDIVGAMFSSNTETRISATYQDGDGTIDLAVDDMTADTNTTYTGGTNLTLDGTTFNVDDAFLKNNADDSTSGTLTAGGFTTTGTWTFDDATSGTVGITTIHTGSSFTDNDTSLMTAGAIKEKIEAYGYTTADGDITSVRFVTDSGSGAAAEDTADTANFSLLGSSGVGITNSGTTITAVAVPAEIDHDSLSNFVANEHIDWTGASAGTIHSTNYTNTTYTGGTNLTLDGTEFDVDDAFITNDADDTMAGTLTIDKDSTATTNSVTKGLSIDYDHTGITASGQSINNVGLDINITDSSPTHVGTHTNYGIKMSTTSNTSGAGTVYGIQNTATGGDTNIGYVSTVTNGGNDFKLYDSADGTNYATISTGADGATTIATVDDSGAVAHIKFEPDGSFLIKETASAGADVAGYGQLWVKSDTPNELYFTTDAGNDIQITDGTSLAGGGGGGASALNDLSDVTYSSGDLTITSLDKIISGALTFDSSGDITLSADGGDVFMDDGTNPIFKFDLDNVAMYMFDDADSGDQFGIAVGANGATTLSTVDDDAANADLTFTIDGSINFDVEGTVEFDGCGVGFDLVTPTYNASDTNVDFLTGNKQFVTFGSGNITDLNLIFPKTSGNFTLILKQDGSGSRTVTNYKVWDRNDSAAASGSATVKFAGGSNPTLTTAASKTDIISFFYDADNEIAYGVASLNF